MKMERLGLRVSVLTGMLVALLIPAAAMAAPDQGQRGPGGGCTSCGGTSTVPLTVAEKQALVDAIHEEYLARNTYIAVMAQLGSISPFSMIARSEQGHINAVSQLFTKYGLAVPPNPGLSPAPVWGSVQAACQSGVYVEKEDIALYDRLLPEVDHADVIQVFTNLRSASINHHLPAFEVCD